MLGNSLGDLARGWGEGRGLNGVIIAAPSEHEKPEGCYEWRRTGPVPAMPGYMASQLPDAMEAAEAATDEQVKTFLAKHTSHTRPDLLAVHCASYQKKVAAGESRHHTMTGPLSGAMKEAAAGLLDAKAAADTLESVFLEAVAQPPVGAKQGKARTGAVARNEWAGLLSWAVAQGLAADPAATRERVNEKVPPPFTEVPFEPNGSTSNGSTPNALAEFWEARPALGHILAFARARRVGPWAMLGCVLVQVVAAVTPKVTLPPLVGGHASLNLFLGIVSETGGGKGAAEDAAGAAIGTPWTLTIGPGSGEGLAHLFMYREKDRDSGQYKLRQHTTAVILSAAEVETMAALKGRQASTLFPELRKAWKGEPLGFAYADPTKRLTVDPHTYRLCLSVGIQPAMATPILEDADAGMPQRFLWLPADDPQAPDEPPEEPGRWHWAPQWTPHDALANPAALRPMAVCQTARDEIDRARLQRLRGNTNGDLDGHALLAQLKIAAALALLDERTTAISEEDWALARNVRKVSDLTRQEVLTTLAKAKIQSNRARGEAEAERAIMVDSRRDEYATERVCRAIMRRLDFDAWTQRTKLRHSLKSPDRRLFNDAIAILKAAGQVEARPVQAAHAGHKGTEYRKVR
jgi:hypothetical protein